MKEKPIIFSTPMVKAILESRKTMTRRVVKSQLTDDNGFVLMKGFWVNPKKDTDRCFDGISPYCVGDRLWVRETWQEDTVTKDGGYFYKADPDGCLLRSWKPSLFMPRKAARIFLEVKSVRVERIQDITEEDAKAEGVTKTDYRILDYKTTFVILWDTLNKKRGYQWESNPWVWVIEFRRIEK
jgi:hypothetical protein